MSLREPILQGTSAKHTEVRCEINTFCLFLLNIADTDRHYNLQDWENIKYNNLKFELPKPEYLTGYARKAEMYLKHGILK